MPTLYTRNRHSSDAYAQHRPHWILYTASDPLPLYLQHGSDHQAAHIFHERFTAAEIPPNSVSRLESLCAEVTTPTFVAGAPQYTSVCAADSEKSFLSFLSFPERFDVEDSRLAYKEGLRLLTHEVDAALQSTVTTTQNDPDTQEKPTKADEICHLSVRLMHGETAQAPFKATESLKDVKRWLQKEKNLSMLPEDDEVISRYVNIGHCEPSRFAFFSPASRTTFTEAEELLRLKDLGLCPRSALILRPDFDVNAIKAARAQETSVFKKLVAKVGPVLQAFYQFCNYDVDEAHRDLQDISDHTIKEMVQPHIYPVAAGASLAVVEDKEAPEVQHDYTFSTSTSAGAELSQGLMEEA